jgi:hypothetical protein
MTWLALAGYVACLVGLVLFFYDLHRQTNYDERRGQG